jgi:Domain of unknown function (DUF4258)
MSKSAGFVLSKPSALNLVRELAKDSGNVIFKDHALKRMRQRHVTPKMVMDCLSRGAIVEGPALSMKGTWELAMQRMGGGQRLFVAMAIDLPSRLIIITVYGVKD